MTKHRMLTPRTALFGGAVILTAALAIYSVALSNGLGRGARTAERPVPSAKASKPRATQPVQGGGWAPPRKAITPRPSSAVDDSEVFDEPLLPEDAPLEERVAQMVRYEESREANFFSEFNAESVDPQWAATWESNLTTSLEGALGNVDGFDGMSIECRRQRCVAEAKWKNYAAAQVGLDAASDATKGACATAVFIRPPDDHEAPYEHSVRFSNCQDAPS